MLEEARYFELGVENARPAFNSLRIEGLGLSVRLGCTSEERARPQEVRIGIELRFREAPRGALTDSLGDTVCYAQVSGAIREHCEAREYQLIERMGHEIYALLRALAGPAVELGIVVHKIRPPVENLQGGTQFRCGDFAL